EQMPLAHEAIDALGLLDPGSRWRQHWHPGARIEAIAPSDPAAGEPLVLVDGEPVTLRRRKTAAPPRRVVREVVASPLGQLRYRVTGSGFWQVHRQAPAVLVEEVLRAAAPAAGRRGCRV